MFLGDIAKFNTLINVQLFAQLEWRKREKKRPKTCVFTRKKTKKGKTSIFSNTRKKTGTAGRRGVGTLPVPGSAGYPNTRGFAVPDPGPGKPLQ